MSAAPLVLIAAGGTGGHMFPAQAFAEEMLRRGWQVRLSTDARGASYAGGFPDAVQIDQVLSATPARGGVLARLMMPFRIGAGIAQATLRLLRKRPDVVVGFGGYPTIPALSAAILTRCPRVIHEQNGVLGRVNRRFAPYVAGIACGTWPTEVPKGVDHHHIGNPVRSDAAARAGAPYIAPGDYPMSLVVIGGSQGARVMTDLVPSAIAHLPEGLRRHLRVSHQARPEDVGRAAEAYAQAGIDAEIESFFDDIPRRISEAQLVIARAGASTLAEITVIGRPSILIPYPYAASDHQTANARALAQAGAAEVLPEHELSLEGMAWAIASILADAPRANAMAAAALQLAKPDAAAELADAVEALRKT